MCIVQNNRLEFTDQLRGQSIAFVFLYLFHCVHSCAENRVNRGSCWTEKVSLYFIFCSWWFRKGIWTSGALCGCVSQTKLQVIPSQLYYTSVIMSSRLPLSWGASLLSCVFKDCIIIQIKHQPHWNMPTVILSREEKTDKQMITTAVNQRTSWRCHLEQNWALCLW